MKKIIITCLVLFSCSVPINMVLADDLSPSILKADDDTSQITKDKIEEIKKRIAERQKVNDERKQQIMQRIEEFKKARAERRAAAEAQVAKQPEIRVEEKTTITRVVPEYPSKTREVEERRLEVINRDRFIDRIDRVNKEIETPKIVVRPSPRILVEPKREAEIVTPPRVVTVVRERYEPESYRERELKERELRLRELELKNREQRLNEKERAFQEAKWYERKLQAREWQDIQQRDRELRYLTWREENLTPFTWEDTGRICRYVTTYKKGARVNKKVTICNRKNGVYRCYHPTKYYIYPVTRVVCYTPRRKVLYIDD